MRSTFLRSRHALRRAGSAAPVKAARSAPAGLGLEGRGTERATITSHKVCRRDHAGQGHDKRAADRNGRARSRRAPPKVAGHPVRIRSSSALGQSRRWAGPERRSRLSGRSGRTWLLAWQSFQAQGPRALWALLRPPQHHSGPTRPTCLRQARISQAPCASLHLNTG